MVLDAFGRAICLLGRREGLSSGGPRSPSRLVEGLKSRKPPTLPMAKLDRMVREALPPLPPNLFAIRLHDF